MSITQIAEELGRDRKIGRKWLNGGLSAGYKRERVVGCDSSRGLSRGSNDVCFRHGTVQSSPKMKSWIR